jgi:hypothetical protein
MPFPAASKNRERLGREPSSIAQETGALATHMRGGAEAGGGAAAAAHKPHMRPSSAAPSTAMGTSHS